MKSFKSLLVGSVLLSLTAQAQKVPAAYEFPLKNPFLATLTVATNTSEMKYKKVEMAIRTDRKHTPLLKGRSKIEVGLFKQDQKSPVVIMIAGLGGNANSGSAIMTAETLFKSGYTVVTLPNPFSWQYVLGVSESATPGYIARDTKEYYEFMQKVMANLKQNQGVEASSYSLMGFSMGGLYAAFLAKEDSQQNVFKFEKTVLINPAVDLKYGLQTLDGYYADGVKLSDARKAKINSLLLTVGQELIAEPLSPNSLAKALPQAAQLTDSDLKWLLAQSFRGSLRDVIYTSQQIKDTGLLKISATKGVQSMRIAEAEAVTFTTYLEQVILPQVKDVRVEDLFYQSSLYSLAGFMKSNSNLYVFENEDDIIVNKNDIAFLTKTLGERLNLYPCGGHLGNLWWEQNKSDLKAVFPVVAK